MANRSSGGSAAKSKTAGSGARGQTRKTAPTGAQAPQPKNNREIAYQKLEELTAPILEKYGVPAFDELMNRLESVIKDFTAEVSTLFKEMVNRSREDHERLKSLLVEEEGAEEQQEELENEAKMSEFEKRLEQMEKKKASKTKQEREK